jgi:hypothetical protein
VLRSPALERISRDEGIAPPQQSLVTAVATAKVARVSGVAIAVAPPPPVVAVPRKGSYALYDFTGVNEGELTCKQNDSLEVQSENGDWLLCALVATGKQGWLPKTYVFRAPARNPFDDA